MAILGNLKLVKQKLKTIVEGPWVWFGTVGVSKSVGRAKLLQFFNIFW